MSDKHVIFVDTKAEMSKDDVDKLEKAGFIVVKVKGNPNQTTRRETFNE